MQAAPQHHNITGATAHLQLVGLQQLLAQAPRLVDVPALQDAALNEQNVLQVRQAAIQQVRDHLQQLVSGGACTQTAKACKQCSAVCHYGQGWQRRI